MKQRTFYTECAYVLGLLVLALGTALMARADLGISMVVAPAYLLHLKISQYFPVFSFGMGEYCLQLVLILGLSAVMGRVKRSYLFSFLTAVIYGFVLDFWMIPVGMVPADGIWMRLVLFLVGMVSCAIGVALLFHTYFAPEAYELVVKEVAAKTGRSIPKVKTVYDLTSLVVGITMSFCFFGFLEFRGIKIGSVVAALANGWLIGLVSKWLERTFRFRDRWNLRKFMEE